MLIGVIIGLFFGIPFGLMIGAVLMMEHDQEVIDEYRRRSKRKAEIESDAQRIDEVIGGYEIDR